MTSTNERELFLILAKAKDIRQRFSELGIYLLPALSINDAIKESLILKKRRDILNVEVDRQKLKIKFFELLNKGVKLKISFEPDAKKGKRLAFLKFHLINARSSNRSERRFKLVIAVLTELSIFVHLRNMADLKVQKWKTMLGNYEIYIANWHLETDVNPRGGSLIAVENSLDSQNSNTALPDCYMACTKRLALSEITFCVFYNFFEDSKYKHTKEDFEAILNNFPKSKQLLISGDVNFPKTNWDNLVSCDECEQEIVEVFGENLLEQSVDFNIRGNNLLDITIHCNKSMNAERNKLLTKVWDCSDHGAVSLL